MSSRFGRWLGAIAFLVLGCSGRSHSEGTRASAAKAGSAGAPGGISAGAGRGGAAPDSSDRSGGPGGEGGSESGAPAVSGAAGSANHSSGGAANHSSGGAANHSSGGAANRSNGGAANRSNGGSANQESAGSAEEPSAGAAGESSAGAGGAADPCTLSVPTDASSIQAAIDAAPVPATVCIEAGLYREDLSLRDGVSLRGIADGVRVCGTITGGSLETGVTLDRIGTGKSLHVSTPARLNVSHFVREDLAECVAPSAPSISVNLTGGRLELTVDHSSLAPQGVAVESFAGPVDVDLAITNSSCLAAQCFDFLHLSGVLAHDSHVRVRVENNLIVNTVLEAIGGSLTSVDANDLDSSFAIDHNTIFSFMEPNSGIYLYGEVPGQLSITNNAIGNFYTPIISVQKTALIGYNLTGFPQGTPPPSGWYDEWFVDAENGDFHPAPGSPLIGAGDDRIVNNLTDPDGVSREQRSDIGAYQASGN